MRERARAVVIGGGVGRLLRPLPPRQARLDGRRPRRAVPAHARLHLALRRPRRPAALVGVADADDDVLRRPLRRPGARDRQDPGWHQLGGLRLASSPARLEEIQRQNAWARTFGLPMEIISAAEAQEKFPLMSTDGVLAAAYLPYDGYLDPSQLTFALADGARRLRRRDRDAHEGARDRAARGPRLRASSPTRAGSSARSSSTPPACTRPRSAGWSASTIPIIPFGHQYVVTEPTDPAAARRCRRCATRTTSSTSAPRSAAS